jgi:hypothetical protein
MKATQRRKQFKSAVKVDRPKITDELKTDIFSLVLDVNSKQLYEEKKALMDALHGTDNRLTLKQVNTLKDYIKDCKDIKDSNKQRYFDALDIVKSGYIVR